MPSTSLSQPPHGTPAPFVGERVLITGASAGIGKAFASALAARGAHLVLSARNTQRLEELAKTLRETHGVDVAVAACDLEQPGAASRLAADLTARKLEVDILVNNAGFGSAGRFQRQAVSHIASMTQLNCVALAELTHALLPSMIAKGRGGIINVGSVSAFVPTPFMAIYGGTKAYVLSFTAALAEELRGSPLRILAVCPGPVPTEFQQRAGYTALDVSNPSTLTAERVVEQALAAYERRQVICVPGAVNRVQTALSGLLPIPWVSAISAWVLRRRGRDL